jgi:hypothetical protein
MEADIGDDLYGAAVDLKERLRKFAESDEYKQLSERQRAAFRDALYHAESACVMLGYLAA